MSGSDKTRSVDPRRPVHPAYRPYNLFVAAGLAWIVYAALPSAASFFLVCVGIAGFFGAMTIKPTTLLPQAVPAMLALLAVWAAARRQLLLPADVAAQPQTGRYERSP